ncbi:MAG: lipase secretion chaperone [Oceanospirillaceae bacterium]|nr:lipase secretion chaperone [Oceanospirillaceae bacterium]
MRYFLIAVSGLCVAGAAYFFLQPVQVTQLSALEETRQQFAQRVADASQSLQDGLHDAAAREKTSLKGTDIDGAYPVGPDGHLLLNVSIKERFEYFLSTLGEFSLDEVLALVRDDISRELQEPARSEALKLFEDYIAYKRSLVELEKQLGSAASFEQYDMSNMRLRLDQLRNKRREYLSAEAADAFFGFDETYDDFMLGKLDIMNNPQLTADEKAAQISMLENQLPAQLQDMRSETERISQVFAQTEKMKQQGATAEEVYAQNTAAFGSEAAARIATLENQRAQWQQRIDTYLAAKKAVEESQRSETQKQQAIEQLRAAFTPQEQLRLAAYE